MGQQLTKTELSTAQATAAAELALEDLKHRHGGRAARGHSWYVSRQCEQSQGSNVSEQARHYSRTRVVEVALGYNTTTVDSVVVTADGH